MQLKKYTIASIILMILVGVYIFGFITQDSTSIDFFGTQFPLLPIALWVVAPMFILFVASLVHMLYYSFINSIRSKKYEKDFEKIVDAMVDAYLSKENRSNSYKTDRYQLLGALVDNSKILPSSNIINSPNNKKISDVLSVIESIRSGGVADLKAYKLPSTNEFVIQNEKNRYKKGDISAESILSSSSKYDESLCKEVFVDYVKKAPLKSIEKYKQFMSKESLFAILSRINASSDTLLVDNEVLIPLFKELKLDRNEYIQASKILAKSMLPEQRMKLFESLSNEFDFVMDAYLYTLFDLEMVSMAKDILSNTQSNEFAKFKIYSSLRESGKRYNIELFI